MDFESLLTEAGIESRSEGDHHCRPGWLQLRCPYCSDGMGESFHLGYNINRHYLNCWRCGKHSLPGTLCKLLGISSTRAQVLLEDIDVPVFTGVERVRGTLKIPKELGPLLRCHRLYLKGRGFDPNELEEVWGIGGIGMRGPLKWRVFIPIHYRGETVSWTTRSTADNATVRYIAADAADEAIPGKNLLYGEDFVSGHSIIIHEGPTDVWRTGPGACCTFGTAYTRKQIARIVKYKRRIICFDSETQAQRQAQRLCDLLEPFPGETLNVVLDAKDAGVASKREIKQLRTLLI